MMGLLISTWLNDRRNEKNFKRARRRQRRLQELGLDPESQRRKTNAYEQARDPEVGELKLSKAHWDLDG